MHHRTPRARLVFVCPIFGNLLEKCPVNRASSDLLFPHGNCHTFRVLVSLLLELVGSPPVAVSDVPESDGNTRSARITFVEVGKLFREAGSKAEGKAILGGSIGSNPPSVR